VAAEIVGLFVSSPDENLAAGGRLQRDETVIKMARVGGLNYRETAALSSSRRSGGADPQERPLAADRKLPLAADRKLARTGAAGRSGSEQLTSDAPYAPENRRPLALSQWLNR
jgi:hypothetical protein